MALRVAEIRAWLDTLKPDDRVGVDEGGLALCVLGDENDYLEVGGLPEGACRHEYALARACGAQVCDLCEDHKGLDRCFCGWARSGGDGRRELIDMGETIEED